MLIDKGQGQCILEPDEALAIPLEDRPPTMRFTPLVTLADLETVGAEAYRPILARLLRDADKRRTVELFESFGPHVVTRKQYDDIVAAQRAKKLELEYNLAWVIQDRFYATAMAEISTVRD